ncbi:Sec1-like, domain 2 [Phytophthora cactorum]|nr:Sec1-like, domain 2 [Phytophthora cactorum]
MWICVRCPGQVLLQMVKHVTQLTRGWVVMVVDDEATRSLTQVARMSELTDCGVSILERMELERQPFPEMNVVYFIAPTAANVRRLARDFEDPNKPKYNDVYIYFVHHAGEEALSELKNAPQALLQRLKALQEVNVDFLAVEKCAFSFGMPEAFHTLYSPAMKKSEKLDVFIRSEEGHVVFIDRGQDMVTPLMHESTFQAMTYDLLGVKDDQISYEAETNSGTTTKTAFLNENDKQWVEFRHTHIAKVSTEIGKRMTALSASNAGTSLGRGKSTDLQAMAAGLRELPEYREMLGKLSQHLFLAGKAMDVFTSTGLLDASNIEQTLATGVEESGKKLKHSTIGKQLEDLFKDPKLTEKDRFRVAAVFALTQDTLKEAERNKVMQAAKLSKKHETILENMALVAGSVLYKQNGNSLISSEELKLATKKAEAVEYSNARYDPKIKSIVASALKRTLSESTTRILSHHLPRVRLPVIPRRLDRSPYEKKWLEKVRPRKLRHCLCDTQESEHFFGEKMIVFVSGGATYSELRSIYEFPKGPPRPSRISMRVIRWTLLIAALAVSVYAKDAAPVKSDAECTAPSVVASFESKIADLKQSNSALQLQVDAQGKEKTKLLADVAKQHEAIVLKLQNDIATLEKDVAIEKQAVEKAKAELKSALDKLSSESKRAASRDRALAKLAEQTKKTTQLEKSKESFEKKNKALLKDLSEANSVELTMASLLSSYYDDALVLAEQAVVYAQEKLNEQSDTLEHVQGHIENAKKTACDTTSKFYQENLAATLDPILVDVHKTVDPIWADVHSAVHPHLERYVPIVQNEAAKAKEQVVVYSQEALRRAKLARIEAITLLEQNEHVAQHAQKVIDGVLILLAIPLVLFQIRLALRLVWWLLTTTLCVLTCGLCCGSRKRSSKTKRKVVKKAASINQSLNAPLNGPAKKTTTKTTSTSQKRAKKGKN